MWLLVGWTYFIEINQIDQSSNNLQVPHITIELWLFLTATCITIINIAGLGSSMIKNTAQVSYAQGTLNN